jgi:hypothetical protein
MMLYDEISQVKQLNIMKLVLKSLKFFTDLYSFVQPSRLIKYLLMIFTIVQILNSRIMIMITFLIFGFENNVVQ